MSLTFKEWLTELNNIVNEELEVPLTDIQEFEMRQARGYFSDGNTPRSYYDECLTTSNDNYVDPTELLKEL
jgi:hypothetical protein